MNPLFLELLKHRTHLTLVSQYSHQWQNQGFTRSTVSPIQAKNKIGLNLGTKQEKSTYSEKKIRPSIIRKQSFILTNFDQTLAYLNQALSFLYYYKKEKSKLNILLLTKTPLELTYHSNNLHIWNTKWIGGSITNKNYSWIWSDMTDIQKFSFSPDLVISTHIDTYKGALEEAKLNRIPCILFDENILTNKFSSSSFIIPGNTQSKEFLIWSLNLLLSTLVNENPITNNLIVK